MSQKEKKGLSQKIGLYRLSNTNVSPLSCLYFDLYTIYQFRFSDGGTSTNQTAGTNPQLGPMGVSRLCKFIRCIQICVQQTLSRQSMNPVFNRLSDTKPYIKQRWSHHKTVMENLQLWCRMPLMEVLQRGDTDLQ